MRRDDEDKERSLIMQYGKLKVVVCPTSHLIHTLIVILLLFVCCCCSPSSNRILLLFKNIPKRVHNVFSPHCHITVYTGCNANWLKPLRFHSSFLLATSAFNPYSTIIYLYRKIAPREMLVLCILVTASQR